MQTNTTLNKNSCLFHLTELFQLKAVRKKEEYFGSVLERKGQVWVPLELGYEATKLCLLTGTHFLLPQTGFFLLGYLLLATDFHPSNSETANLFFSRSPSANILGVTVTGQVWRASQPLEQTVWHGDWPSVKHMTTELQGAASAHNWK